MLTNCSQLESVYRSAPIVLNICVYAASDKLKPIAIVVPVEKALKELAASLGVEGDGIEQLVHDKKVHAAALKQMVDVGRKGGLRGIELIEGLVLADEEWTPQNVSHTRTAKPDSWLTRFPGPSHLRTEAAAQADPAKVREGGQHGLRH